MKRLYPLFICVLAIGGCNKEQENKAAWAKIDRDFDSMNRKIEEDTKQIKIRYVSAKHGEVMAAEYERCVMHPPELEKNKVKCRKLIDRIETEMDKLPMSTEKKW
jgi:uncharacterized lipoprotein NlpE involved in copper resistance